MNCPLHCFSNDACSLSLKRMTLLRIPMKIALHGSDSLICQSGGVPGELLKHTFFKSSAQVLLNATYL